MISFSEHIAYHALATSCDGNYDAVAALHDRHPSWDAAWKTRKRASSIDDDRAFQKLETLGITLLLFGDPDFPPLLREIPRPPFGIYVQGKLPSVQMTCLAIVGTRKASPQGKTIARQFATALARATLPIVSGLALGIDAEAHLGALDGGGTTVAVMACGLDAYYPRQHTTLARKILAHGGAVVSEYAPGTPAYPLHFLERNRIVSGLSRGVLVVEAPVRSGALATSRFAVEQNRDVFVIPGPITHPNYIGSLGLIQSGAILVTTPEDILNEYHISPVTPLAQAVHILPTLPPDEARIYAILLRAGVPLAVDNIVSQSTLEPHVVMRTLTFLAMKDLVVERDGCFSAVCNNR